MICIGLPALAPGLEAGRPPALEPADMAQFPQRRVQRLAFRDGEPGQGSFELREGLQCVGAAGLQQRGERGRAAVAGLPGGVGWGAGFC